jgi:hypothetical protein
VTLARAIYSPAEILLLDVHTARWVIEKCFKGDLVRGRTVILVVRPQRVFLLLTRDDVGYATDAQCRDGEPDCGICHLAQR